MIVLRTAILSCAFLCATSNTEAQLAQDPDDLARTLFPRNQEMSHWRLREIADRLGLHAGSRVADVGCGHGEIALVWSLAVGPNGHVWAEDIDPQAVKTTRRLIKEHRARNVTVLLGNVADPRLPPAALDGISLFFVYHELVKYPEMLARFREALKPDGRLVILDPLAQKTATRPRAAQTRNHVLKPDLAREELQKAGFEVLSGDDHFVDDPDSERTDWLIVARPVPRPQQ